MSAPIPDTDTHTETDDPVQSVCPQKKAWASTVTVIISFRLYLLFSVSTNGETETLKSLKRALALTTQLASCGVNTRWWSVDAAKAPATGLEVRTPHTTLLATAYVALSP